MIPDAAKACKKLILDCDGRLAGLFTRSFPQVRVYGTRVKQAKWDVEDRDIEASLPLGQVGEFFRTTDESFPGTPYLVPCPIRMRQWKTLWAEKGKPVIGLAWTGGVPKSNSRNRRLTLEQLLPVLSLDAHFVCLQYQDARKEIDALQREYPQVDLVQYPWATLTQDYDDTAALVASLDHVLCIQTAVAHTAGGLGVPVTVLLPTATTWRYGVAHETIPWYRCLKVIRQQQTGSWGEEIERARASLADLLRLPTRAGTAPRERGLRNSLYSLRAAGLEHYRENGGATSA